MGVHEVVQEARDEELLRRMVSGQSLTEAAEEMGWNVNALRRAAARPSFRALARQTVKGICADWDLEFEERGTKLQQLLKDNAMDAVETIASLMRDGRNDRVRLSAATEILDRADLGLENRKSQIPQVHFHVTAETIAVALQTAKQLESGYQPLAGGELSEKD